MAWRRAGLGWRREAGLAAGPNRYALVLISAFYFLFPSFQKLKLIED
jgi:hypothetical protein